MNAPKEQAEHFEFLWDMQNLKGMSWHGVMLKHAKEYNGAILPTDIPWGPPKSCFETCQKYTLYEDYGVRYCEGSAASEDVGVALPHAWLLRDGKVIDPVWGPGRHEYFGIEIPDYIIQESIRRTQWWGSILEDGYLVKLGTAA